LFVLELHYSEFRACLNEQLIQNLAQSSDGCRSKRSVTKTILKGCFSKNFAPAISLIWNLMLTLPPIKM